MRRVNAAYSVAATTTTAELFLQSPDDNNIKTLRRVYISPQAAGALIVTVKRAGFQLEVFDSQRCANGNWPIDVDEQYPALIQFEYNIQNTTGGTLTGSIIFEYEPGASPGSRPAPNTQAL